MDVSPTLYGDDTDALFLRLVLVLKLEAPRRIVRDVVRVVADGGQGVSESARKQEREQQLGGLETVGVDVHGAACRRSRHERQVGRSGRERRAHLGLAINLRSRNRLVVAHGLGLTT